jgi:hypothetical protein
MANDSDLDVETGGSGSATLPNAALAVCER